MGINLNRGRLAALLIFFIIVMGSILRLFWLDRFPGGFSADEAQQGYTAYSILLTGRDEWGQFLPLFPRGFGDYKPPLYVYLATIPVGIFGLNEFATRLPSAMAGIALIVVVYFLTKKWFGDKKIALWACFLASISPWHIQLSRTAFEGILGVLFFALGFWMYLKGKAESRYLLLSGIFFGVSLYTYHSFRAFTLLFMGVVLLRDWRKLKANKLILPLVIFLLFISPILLNFNKSLARFSDVTILSSSTPAPQSSFGNLPFANGLGHIFTNPLILTGGSFIDNYLSFASSQFFFTGSRSADNYLNFSGASLLYLPEVIFLLWFLITVIKNYQPNYFYAIAWLLLAPVPASLTGGGASANRVVTFLPLLTIISSVGLVNFIHFLTLKLKLSFRISNIVISSLLFAGLFYFIYQYFYQLPQAPAASIRFGYKQIFNQAIVGANNYQNVVFTHSFTEPQIFVAFYGKLNPRVYQQAAQDWLRYESEGKVYVDQLSSYSLGKFEFRDIAWNDERFKKGVLFAGKPTDFPGNISPLYRVTNSRGQVLFELVESDKNKDKTI